MKAARRIAIVSVVAVAALALLFRSEIRQFWAVLHLFDEGRIEGYFRNMDGVFPYNVVARGERVFEFRRGRYTPPSSFRFGGRSFETEAYLVETASAGMLVAADDAIVFERYWDGYSDRGRHIAWSVSKSFVSALFGIAIQEGLIAGVHEPVTHYVPELAGSGYDGVSIKDVLQMSSGVRFNEDYGDFDSDINRMGRVMALGRSFLDFSASLEREREPGTFHHYVSIDTQVLGTILVRATGRSLAEYTSEKLWKPLGMELDAYWITDSTGMEMALGGLNAGLRDLARFGRLYLHGGSWNGEQIVPRSWVEASLTPDAPHLQPGPNPNSSDDLGYGYQWWIPEGDEGEFMALGIYDQMIYVHPGKRLVIAKNSAHRDFQRNDFEPTDEHLALFRAIAADF